jgi:hypothetical protein
MSAILGFLSSAAFGGVTGLAGVAVNKVSDYFTQKQRNAFDLAMKDKDIAVAQIESAKEIAIARDTNMTNRELAEEATLQASYAGDKAQYFSGMDISGLPGFIRGGVAFLLTLVDFIRGMTRPGITLYMCVLTTLMYKQMTGLVSAAGGGFTPGDAAKIIFLIVDSVIYLTTVCVTWWFGSRPKSMRQ